MPQAMGKNSKRNAPRASDNKSRATGCPLDLSGAGAVDSRLAVGSSGDQRCIECMQLKRENLGRESGIKCHAHSWLYFIAREYQKNICYYATSLPLHTHIT